MSYYRVYRKCVNFYEVWRSNVHDVRKVCLETTLCVLACFVESYVFVFDDIDMRGTKLVYDHILVVNSRAILPKDQPRVLEEGPFTRAKDVKTSPTYGWQSTTRGSIDAL